MLRRHALPQDTELTGCQLGNCTYYPCRAHLATAFCHGRMPYGILASQVSHLSVECRLAAGPPLVSELKVNMLKRLQLHPVVPPQVSHFRQVPFRTMVKLPHSGQASPT
jgi:hypothetical protein